MRKVALLFLIALLPVLAWAKFSGAPITSGGLKDNTVTPAKLKTSTSPDNTMVPYWDNDDFRWAAPSAGTVADNSVTTAKIYTTGGTPSATTFHRGDNTWATPAGSGTVTEVTGTDGIAVANGTTTPALSLTDNGVSGVNLTDNTVTDDKIAALAWAKLTGVPATFTPASHGNASHSSTFITAADNAAGLAAQYIDWNSSSGGSSIANKPTLGTIASQAANSVSISGGSITDITDLAIADGGTGASSAGAALTALGADNASNIAKGLLAVAYGGTGNAFFTVSGPATSAKTYTFPNASATVLTDNTAVTVAQGGTGRATGTTAYALVATGTTATGAQQTLGSGATTQILVGGGASALPAWGTAIPDGVTATTQTANDNTGKLATTAYVDGRNQHYRVNIDAPATTDNIVFDGPLARAIILDNVIALVQDNSAKLSGSASDNVTFQIGYCSSISTPTCTNVFTSAPTALGTAVLSPAMNNTAPAAGDYLRLTITTTNMTNKKLYLRIRYHE